jgi:hypothetical protein
VSDTGHHAGKPWQRIAEEIIREPDLNRVAELSTELIEALDETERPPTSSAIEQPASRASKKKAS